jgi:hypothetical protein
MAIAESWHVRARGRECAATQTSFSEGETIVTALFPDPESSGYLRRDFCIQGWTDHQASGETAFSFWRTTYSIPTGNEKPNPVEKLSAEEILRRLVDEDEDHTENTRFILAVMLERQKILRETDSQRTPNGIVRVYEQRKTGEIYIVKDPDSVKVPEEISAQLMIMFQAVDVLGTQDELNKFMKFVNKVPSSEVQAVFFTMMMRNTKAMKIARHNLQIAEWAKNNHELF